MNKLRLVEQTNTPELSPDSEIRHGKECGFYVIHWQDKTIIQVSPYQVLSFTRLDTFLNVYELVESVTKAVSC